MGLFMMRRESTSQIRSPSNQGACTSEALPIELARESKIRRAWSGRVTREGPDQLFPHLLFCRTSSRVSVGHPLLLTLWAWFLDRPFNPMGHGFGLIMVLLLVAKCNSRSVQDEDRLEPWLELGSEMMRFNKPDSTELR